MISMRKTFGDKSKIDLRKISVYPYLIAIYPPLSLYVQNINIVSITEVLFALFLQIVLLTITIFVLNKIINNKRKSSLIASVLFLLLFSYGQSINHALRLLKTKLNLDLSEFFLGQLSRTTAILLTLFAFVFIVFFFFIYKIRSELKIITLYLNICSLILIFSLVYQSSSKIITQNKFSADILRFDKITKNEEYLAENSLSDHPPENLPNIYYIILDGYGRGDILRDVYHYDNDEIYNYLVDNDFYLAPSSNSNYAITSLSLASSLNLDYLWRASAPRPSSSENTQPVFPSLKNNKLIEFLNEMGYYTISFDTGYTPIEPRNYDLFHPSISNLTPFWNGIINLTPLRYWLFRYQYRIHNARINYIFDNLPASNDTEQPYFVFAHIISPHPPFVFKSNGDVNYLDIEFNLNDGTSFKGEDFYIENYINQLVYVNQRIQEVIQKIQSNPQDNSIIVLQSDHGPAAMLHRSNVHERMGILNAYYFPDQDYSKLYPDISPVNSFRVILDQYLGTNYGLLDDRNYFSLFSRPYDFTDVTHELNQGK